MIWVCLENAVTTICFTALAILFDHWWIVFFSILFFTSYESAERKNIKKEDQDELP